MQKSKKKNLKNAWLICEAYEAINAVVKKADDYVSQWTRYQALWDLQPDILFERLGTDLSKWMKLILEMRKSRTMIDSRKSQHKIFPFVVDHTHAQSKLALRYDYWRREVLSNFGVKLGASMQYFFAIISKARTELELQSCDPSNTSATVTLVTHVQNVKKQVKQYQEQVDTYIAAQKLLIAYRFAFPRHWLYVENVEGEWSALLDVLSQKEVAILTQQIRIMEEEELLEKHINDVIADWDNLKPVSVLQQPHEAIIQLDRFEDKFKRLKDERANIVEAKNALEISELLGHASHHQQEATNKLNEAIEELVKLQGIWKAFLPEEQN